ncbi:MAG: hypothetical protein ABWK15_03100 [Dissulfuribacterales bacterium]
MLNTFQIYEELASSLGDNNARIFIKVVNQIYEDLRQSVTKSEFNELKAIVADLAVAQKRTEERVEELAQAQKRTEERLEELAQAQKRTEEQVKELAQAQKRTEERLEELAQAQKRTEEQVKELAQAQKRTEETLNALIIRVDKIEDRLEGISNSVGYSLEDRAYKALPSLLKFYGIDVTSKVIRKYIEENQINIYARGTRNGKEMTILGECKVRPSKKEIDKFLKISKIAQKDAGIKDMLLVFVANDYHPNVEQYLNEKGIIYFWSYDL